MIWDDKVLKKWIALFVIREDVTLKEDGSVDVNGDVDFISRRENSGQSVISRVNPLFLDQIPLRFNEIKGNFDCSDNKKKFTKEEVRKVCKVKENIYV